MDKITGIAGIAALIRNQESQQIKKSEKTTKSEKTSAGNSSISHTLENMIKARLQTVDPENENKIVEAFIKGTLDWEFGHDIETDASYASLLKSIITDINGNSTLKQKIINLLRSLD